MHFRIVSFLLAQLGAHCSGFSVSSDTVPTPPAIDFSCAGYAAGHTPPTIQAVIRVRATGAGADDTALLQAAIDHVAGRPADGGGFRGALILDGANGPFRVAGSLRLGTSGVVLRGTATPTAEIIATGRSRRTLIEIGGRAPAATEAATPIRVVAENAPPGATSLALESTSGLSVGDRVVVRRPSTKEWIAALGMDQFTGNFANQRTHWLPGSRDLVWDREVIGIDAASHTIVLDAPVTTALEQRFGGATVTRVKNDPVRNIGLEQLVLTSEFDPANAKDEEHSWIAVALDHVEDAWVRGVTARHFAGSAVRAGPRARRITVVDCRSEQPVSEIGGYRRQSFLVEGQQVLIEQCSADSGWNDFATGMCAAGPNVFRDCTATNALGASGTFESWASGVLYERVVIEGGALRLTRDDAITQGAGWTATNSIVRDCIADEIVVDGPHGSPVVIEGGERPPGRPLPTREPVRQIRQAEGSQAQGGERVLTTARPYPAGDDAVPAFTPPPPPSPGRGNDVLRPLSIEGGRFVLGGRAVWGGQINSGWWRGQVSPNVAVAISGRNITRFAPGRSGPGLTEDLEQLASDMVHAGLPHYVEVPGLWYDRRRDDHRVIERSDASVWAPFYEMPWARSGTGTAWDGLSTFDLSKLNPWYFERVREFAEQSERSGLVFHNFLYNAHNVYETLAHWVDYPWRPENNVNDTGLPQPQTIDPGNTIHIADQIFDVSNAARRTLHREFILHTLNATAGCPNVIHSVAFQFAGPLAFQEFFIDTVSAWERETGNDAKVALITSKDITDAVLADPARAAVVDVIDMRYWQRLEDGSMWAPRGDVNRAFREQNTERFGRGVDSPPDTKPLFVYQAVREYRDRFSDKAIVAWNGGAGPIPILMAGGAQALVRNPSSGQSQNPRDGAGAFAHFVREHLSFALPRLTPRDGWLADPENTWCLADDAAGHVLLFSLSGAAIESTTDFPNGSYDALWYDPQSGTTPPSATVAIPDGRTALSKPSAAAWLLLLTRKP